MSRLAFAVLVLAGTVVPSLGCTPNPDPDLRPWKERVAGSSPMFIGTVVEIRGEDGTVWQVAPECETPGATRECEAFHYGFATVVFEVELAIAGVAEATFTVEQGRGSDCRVEFGLGQRWLYAGNFLESPSMYLNQSYDYEQAMKGQQ
jgi:hypothetical protein